MNKYTYEQKQMIVNELNELLTKEETRKYGVSMDGDTNKLKIYEYVYPSKFTPSDLIRKRIKDLSSLTFSDIKNKVGVRFKLTRIHKDRIFMICNFASDPNKKVVLNTASKAILDTSSKIIRDNDLVEVINE